VGEDERPETAESTLLRSDVSADMMCWNEERCVKKPTLELIRIKGACNRRVCDELKIKHRQFGLEVIASDLLREEEEQKEQTV